MFEFIIFDIVESGVVYIVVFGVGVILDSDVGFCIFFIVM